MKKLILVLTVIFVSCGNQSSKEELPSIKSLCKDVTQEIRDLELQKKNLKKEFKQIDSDTEQFELLPDFTKDINETVKQQISKAKLYHYLECSRFEP